MGILSQILEHPVEQPGVEEYDVLVIGGGIAGMEASLDLAEMGFKVLLVEKDPSIGGKMFLLSKVFPTLDCASCISTPKMAAVAHHPNIKVMTYSEVKSVEKKGEGEFLVEVLKKPRFVMEDLCTGCALCEKACPVIIPKEYDFGLRGRKAAYIPFDTAVPKIAMIDIDHCIFCGQCELACPVGAINFLQKPVLYKFKVGAVIIATGYQLFPITKKKEYMYGKLANVITAMQMDRLLSPTRPYNSVLRPSDGKEPMNIAFVLCSGSRDRTVGNPLCSQICCMYSIKQAQLLMGALPLADITIYYMDIRAFGKGFEEFYQQAKDMGVMFVKGRVAKIEPGEDGDIIVYYEDIENGGRLQKSSHDLVVLSVGILPNPGIAKVFKNVKLEIDEYGYIKLPENYTSTAETSVRGVFAAGCAVGPKDIPDTVVEAAAAASQAAAYLMEVRKK
ncbi:MAG: CoB--CoM heterodisulfide reductase iron-sulfur subunit A family protein [Desulfurococcales archaeon]|nr:CoB--CoM heterodisulfide reductase iron-sulfur subunit A family protein [Desulfurococcales archaeon]